MSKSFEELISKANQKTLKKVSVSNAQDEPVLQAVKAAKEQNIATAILVGDEAKIREIAASIDMDLTDFEIINEPDTEAAALKAVELVHNGKADILLKGLLETKTFLKSVLNKGVGLRTGSQQSMPIISPRCTRVAISKDARSTDHFPWILRSIRKQLFTKV